METSFEVRSALRMGSELSTCDRILGISCLFVFYLAVSHYFACFCFYGWISLIYIANAMDWVALEGSEHRCITEKLYI